MTEETTKTLAPQDYFDNFPFESMRDRQKQVLIEICEAFNSGYMIIVVDAPGFGQPGL